MKLFSVNEKGELSGKDKLEFNEVDSYIVDEENTIYIWIGRKVTVNQKDIAVKSARSLNKQKGSGAKLILLDQGHEYGSFLFLMEILKVGVPSEEVMESRGQFELKAPDEIAQVAPEKAETQINAVIAWLDQIKTYRGVAPEEEPKKPIVQEEEKEEFEEDIIIKSEKEPGVIGWLTQMKTYRTTILPKTEVKKDEAVKKVETIKKEEKIKQEEPIQDWIEETPPIEDLKPEINLRAYFLSKEGHSYDALCWLMAEKQLKIQMAPKKPTEDQIKEKAEEVFHSSTSYDELCWLLAELTIYQKYGYFEMF